MSELSPLLDRLRALKFVVHEGTWEPFGETLPMVAAVAWERRTAQLAIIALDDPDFGEEEWRQLLFAGSAVRHHLRADGPSALGPPTVLAVADDDGMRQLRRLAERLHRDYMLFTRVDLNLVPRSALADRTQLDEALAPLLPHCREAIGQEISHAEVNRFWDMLRQEIRKAAASLRESFGSFRDIAANEAEKALLKRDTSDDLPAPWPVAELSLENFRSVACASLKLAPATVICGPNGSGKSSLIEALEIAWSGTTQRKPPDVPTLEYERHLPTDGVGDFSIRIDREKRALRDRPSTRLARSVLTHDNLSAIVGRSPADRYLALLQVTGLEVPDLKGRTGTFLDSAKASADAALRKAGLPPLPRRDSHGERHLTSALRQPTGSGLPDLHPVTGAERALSEATNGAYVPRKWMSRERARAALDYVNKLVERVIAGAEDVPLRPAIDDAVHEVEQLVEEFRNAWRHLNDLLTAIDAVMTRPPKSDNDTDETALDEGSDKPSALPADLAARWLAHANSLRDASDQFESEADGLKDPAWQSALRDYAHALRTAADGAPIARLRRVASRKPRPAPKRHAAHVDAALFSASGFSSPAPPALVAEPLRVLVNEVAAHGSALAHLARMLREHPATRYLDHAPEILASLCRYELARQLRREGPVMNASETLVRELLDERLAPVVRELVAAITRFEWYFHPLEIPSNQRAVVFGGLATPKQDLDARLLLNAAEANALGIAWFLALHMLQPPEQREVLVLDDPISGFDQPNLAGLISTLRAYVRLTRPKQVIITTHDKTTAALLVDELSAVDGWPEQVVLLRCERGEDHRTVVKELSPERGPSSLDEEVERLGLQPSAPVA